MTHIICSHGFGVTKTGRGLFTDIAAALPEHTFELFDYNIVHGNRDIEVATLDEQAATLQGVIDAAPEQSVLLCHSQGSMIAGMVDLRTVAKVIMLAPPLSESVQSVMSMLSARVESNAPHPQKIIRIPRKDGTNTLVSTAYIEEMMNTDPKNLYHIVANTTPTVIVNALDDELVGNTSFSDITVQQIDLSADHNFTGAARNELIAILKDSLRTEAM